MPEGTMPNSTEVPLTRDMPVEYDRVMPKPPNEPIMKRTAIFLRPDQIEELKVLSDLTGAPWAELIRRSLDQYIESRKDEIEAAKKSIGRKK
jgi:predicted DNA-binding protein